MIIRCPDCTTGFELPDEQVSEQPMKVRCSRCSHLFKVGLIDDQPMLYDQAGERLPEEDQHIQTDESGGQSDDDLSGITPPSNLSEDRSPRSNTMMGTGAVAEPDETTGDSSEDEADSPSDADDPAAQPTEKTPAVEPGDERQTVMGMPGDESEQGEETESAPSSSSSRTTHRGVPAADEEASGSGSRNTGGESSSSSDYNPFPHADSDIGPNKSKAITGSGESDDGESQAKQPAGEAADANDDAELELFDEDEQASDQQSGARDAPGGAESSDDSPNSEAAQSAPGPQGPPHSQGPPQNQGPPDQRDAVDLQTGGDTDDQQQLGGQAQSNEYHKEYFDPETGEKKVKGADGGGQSAASGEPGGTGAPGARSNAPNAAGSPGEPDQQHATGGGSEVQSTPDVQSSAAPQSDAPEPDASSGPPTGGGSGGVDGGPGFGGPEGGDEDLELETVDSGPTTGRSSGSPTGTAGGQADNYPLDEVDRVDNQQYSSSGFQKFANILLVALIVGGGFLTVVAAQNSWFVDFANFRQMLEVAFQDGEYEPREEWTNSGPTVQKVASDEPIEFTNVFGQTITLENADAELLSFQGDAENVSEEDFDAVEVRGLVYDAQGKVVAQQTAPLGAAVAPSKLRSLESPDTFGTLMPDKPAELDNGDTQPFTIVFPEVPAPVADGERVEYAVEVAD